MTDNDRKKLMVDDGYCAEWIMDEHRTGLTWVPRKCKRKNGYGEEGMYCKQHAKIRAKKEKP